MSWIEHHRISEDHESQGNYLTAATHELLAINHVDPVRQPRTFGITVVSAAWLYVKAGMPNAAMKVFQVHARNCPAWAQEQLTELMEMIECDSTKS